MEKPNVDAGSPTDTPAVAPTPADAVQHVASAHQQLKTLRERLGILNKHPELEEALTKLEMALSALSVNTGGMW
jgi:hypothetical protein